ncbi:MAG: guanylate kinase [Isosphaeraceae bacterium]|jgi:guanylate kinase|nr:MAG: guanylate kinase [Isosphaeraceae bacterium]
MWIHGWGELPGRLFVVSGPSGSGKTTVLRLALERPGVHARLSVSATSRPPRPGEVAGREYIFLSPEEFARIRDAGQLLEWASYNGNLYGTPAAPVFEALQRGERIVLEIETQGAMQVRDRAPTARFIFIDTPDFDTLAQRLRARATETDEQVHQRLVTARHERDLAHCYDVRIINDDLNRAADELASILRAG